MKQRARGLVFRAAGRHYRASIRIAKHWTGVVVQGTWLARGVTMPIIVAREPTHSSFPHFSLLARSQALKLCLILSISSFHRKLSAFSCCCLPLYRASSCKLIRTTFASLLLLLGFNYSTFLMLLSPFSLGKLDRELAGLQAHSNNIPLSV